MDYQFERPIESKTKEQATRICNRIIHWLVYVMIFLVPLFFLPDTVDLSEYNKQYFIWLVVSFAALVWIFRMVFLEKKVIWKRTPLDIPVLIFFIANFLIYIFSVDRYLSFGGIMGYLRKAS